MFWNLVANNVISLKPDINRKHEMFWNYDTLICITKGGYN